MKTDTIDVGTKIGTEVVKVECSIRIAENLGDLTELAKGSEEFAVKMFNRGWRIWNQEASGARDFVKAATVTEREAPDFAKRVQAVVDAADPTNPPKRTGRPAKPAEITVTDDIAKAMKKGDSNALAALLAAQGVKVNFTSK